MIINIKVYRLKFVSALHIYSEGYAYEKTEYLIHSDTLFSAVVSSAIKLYGDSVIKLFIDSESLYISSAFPYYKEEYFFPKPFNYFKDFSEYKSQKKFKKIKYLTKSFFEKIINGYGDDFGLNFEENLFQNCYFENPISEKDFALYKESEVPRVIIDRITNSTNIFYFSEIFLNSESGLYFMFKCKDSEVEKYFDSALSLLGDEGIGADNSVGKGLFKYTKSEIQLEVPESSNDYLLLSLYSPPLNEFDRIDFNNSYYKIITRGGWVSGGKNMNLRRKTIRMLEEGSVIKVKNGYNPRGEIVKVLEKNANFKIDFDIFRYGRVFSIPLKLGGGNE